MTHYLAELYSPKPQWLALDQAARLQFFEAVGAGLQALSELGVEAITLGRTDATTLHASRHTFLAVWRAPNVRAIDALVTGIAASGWHDYFDTINASSAQGDFQDHLAQLIAA
jgi:hypothetical protein